MDEIEDAVEKYGGHWTINADEVSAKSFIKPRTLWHEAGGPPPIIPSNHTGKEAFTTIFATTAAGHKLKPAVFVVGKTDAVLKTYAESAKDAHLKVVENRWVNQEMWEWYIQEVIVPFCEGHAAALVIDHHGPHISPESIALCARNSIHCIQVPVQRTGELQPNDVGVYGPLTAIVRTDWIEGKRTDPAAWDGLACSVARYLRAWRALGRDIVRSAWVKAVPSLATMGTNIRHSAE